MLVKTTSSHLRKQNNNIHISMSFSTMGKELLQPARTTRVHPLKKEVRLRRLRAMNK